MTANVAPDPERALEAYAEATRIVASAQLVRRFQQGVADERARSAGRPWSGLAATARGVGSRLTEPFGIAFAPHVTFAIRLQALALVLLTVLILGALVGGAGTVLVSVVQGPHRGAQLPGLLVGPDASTRTPDRAPLPVVPLHMTSALPSVPNGPPTSVVSVRVLAQRTAHHRHPHRRHHVRVSRPAPCHPEQAWSRDRHCAS